MTRVYHGMRVADDFVPTLVLNLQGARDRLAEILTGTIMREPQFYPEVGDNLTSQLNLEGMIKKAKSKSIRRRVSDRCVCFWYSYELTPAGAHALETLQAREG